MPLLTRLMGVVSALFAGAFFVLYKPLLALADIPTGNPFFVQLLALLGVLVNWTLVVASKDLLRYRALFLHGVAAKTLAPILMLYHLALGNVTFFILVPLLGDLGMSVTCFAYMFGTRRRPCV